MGLNKAIHMACLKLVQLQFNGICTQAFSMTVTTFDVICKDASSYFFTYIDYGYTECQIYFYE